MKYLAIASMALSAAVIAYCGANTLAAFMIVGLIIVAMR
jgi:hypothetical protein